MRRVVVVDYGVGNLHSVVKALRHEGADVSVSEDVSVLGQADRLVLPGVGAFADGVRGLHARSLIEPLVEYTKTERPLLGICLGMQLLLGGSEEFGSHCGLGVIDGTVRAIPKGPGVKVPQIGWNRIWPRPGGSWVGTLLDPVVPGSMVYFVHSYTAVPASEVHRLADADYGGHRIAAAVQQGATIGCQFHPEKSGSVGLAIIRRFLEL